MAARRRPVPSGRLHPSMTARRLALPVACLLALAGLVRGPLHRATFGLPVSNDDAIPLLMARHLLRGELVHDPLEPAVQRRPRRVPAGPRSGPGVRAPRLSGLRGGVCGAPRRARLLPRPGDLGNRRRRDRGGPRRLRHALHGLDDGHGPASEFPHAPRDGPAPGRGPRPLDSRERRPGAARTVRLRPARPRLRPRDLELVPGHSRVRGHGGRTRCGRRAARPPGSHPRRGFRGGGAPGREPPSRGAALRSLGHVGRDRGQRRDRAQAALAVGAGPPRSGPRRPGPAGPAGPPGGGRSRAGVLAPGREPHPGCRPHPLAVAWRALATCAASRGLGRQLSWAPSSSRVAPDRTSCGTSTASTSRSSPCWGPEGRDSWPAAARPRWPWGWPSLVPWGLGHRRVWEAWRDPAHAARVWQVPPLGPALEALGRGRIESVYASLQFAGRLTLESEERVIASQAWNERIPGDPLRFRDEVDLDPRVAWALSPHLSRGMPRADGFRELLRGLGGSWREERAGDLVVFGSFRAPYDETRPIPGEAMTLAEIGGGPLGPAVLDRDPATAWTAASGLRAGAGIELGAPVAPSARCPRPGRGPRIVTVRHSVAGRARRPARGRGPGPPWSAVGERRAAGGATGSPRGSPGGTGRSTPASSLPGLGPAPAPRRGVRLRARRSGAASDRAGSGGSGVPCGPRRPLVGGHGALRRGAAGRARARVTPRCSPPRKVAPEAEAAPRRGEPARRRPRLVAARYRGARGVTRTTTSSTYVTSKRSPLRS